jgi:hypothetical protein
MKILNVVRTSILGLRKSATSLFAMFLVFGLCAQALAAPHVQKARATAATQQGGSTTGGVGRGDNGQVLRVSVTLNGKPVAKAIVKVTVGDGSVVLSGFTLPNGTFSRSLDAGVYNVTATSGKSTATTSVTIVQSNDPDMVSLALTPAPAPAKKP